MTLFKTTKNITITELDETLMVGDVIELDDDIAKELIKKTKKEFSEDVLIPVKWKEVAIFGVFERRRIR